MKIRYMIKTKWYFSAKKLLPELVALFHFDERKDIKTKRARL